MENFNITSVFREDLHSIGISMIKIYKANDFKVSFLVFLSEYEQKKLGLNKPFCFLCPMQKNLKSIKTDYKQKYNSDNKNSYIIIGSENPYNSGIHIFKDGTWSQYRDGSIYEYVGKIGI